jgi:hypothetical protein
MFPPRADECKVIEFSAALSEKRMKDSVRRIVSESLDGMETHGSLEDYRAARIAKREARLLEVKTAPETLTATCRNQRMRLSRRDACWATRDLTAYWRARLDWHSALSHAQCHGIADANSFPKCDEGKDRFALVDLWRAALVKQMLTPAPDVAAIAWKRAQIRAENFRYADVKPERLQHAIDADVEWLKAHPTKKSIAASLRAEKSD